MTITTRKRSYACVLLLILLAAIVGQKVHIFTEDPLHFEAFCRDLMSDDHESGPGIAEQCAVDDYCFFPCVCVDMPALEVVFSLLGEPVMAPVCDKSGTDTRLVSLRAPPAAV